MDWCDSGTGLDLPFVWLNRWQEDENPSHSCGDVQLFSGCQDNQTSSGAQFTCFASTKVQILTIRSDVFRRRCGAIQNRIYINIFKYIYVTYIYMYVCIIRMYVCIRMYMSSGVSICTFILAKEVNWVQTSFFLVDGDVERFKIGGAMTNAFIRFVLGLELLVHEVLSYQCMRS